MHSYTESWPSTGCAPGHCIGLFYRSAAPLPAGHALAFDWRLTRCLNRFLEGVDPTPSAVVQTRMLGPIVACFKTIPRNQTIGVFPCPASTPRFAVTTTLYRTEKRKESEIYCGFRSGRFRPWILASETARPSVPLPEIPAQDATELNWMP